MHLVEQPAATESATADASLVGDRYRLGHLLTADPRRRVHEGWDTRLQRAVALVLVAPAPGTDREPMLPAAPTARLHLHRPGLAELYDGGVHAGELFLVCQRVPGPTLEQRLATRCTVPELADLVRAVAGILAEVHRRGAVHGALTPARVLLGGGHPVVAECGVAGLVEQWSGLADATPFRAPEQATGHTGPAADVHALGRVLLDAPVRRPLSPGARALRALGRRMTAVAPEQRPDAVEVASTLAAITAASRGGPDVAATSLRARRRLARAIGAVAVLGGLVLGASTAGALLGHPAPGGSALVAPPGRPAVAAPSSTTAHRPSAPDPRTSVRATPRTADVSPVAATRSSAPGGAVEPAPADADTTTGEPGEPRATRPSATPSTPSAPSTTERPTPSAPTAPTPTAPTPTAPTEPSETETEPTEPTEPTETEPTEPTEPTATARTDGADTDS
ncbi:hypothetical protein GCM10023203_34400 [Actinomycetospora straminea]|uniref:non-specific serine/threonine protein kinase n=1 Tax=Actinomycetospora straminea TaxID=663607 RepID=A0ABP9EJ92_9PSEU